MQLLRLSQVAMLVGQLSVLAACHSPAEPELILENVEFTTDRDVYGRGDSIEARLTNGSGDELSYNLCYAWFERQVLDSWEHVGPFGLPICSGAAVSLPAGETALMSSRIPAVLPTGVHRLRTLIQAAPADNVDHYSSTFRVE
jgi:hypothetical protein